MITYLMNIFILHIIHSFTQYYHIKIKNLTVVSTWKKEMYKKKNKYVILIIYTCSILDQSKGFKECVILK